jgi:hypothetical protein
MKRMNMPLKRFDDLKKWVIEDYAEGDINKLTARDIVEIWDAGPYADEVENPMESLKRGSKLRQVVAKRRKKAQANQFKLKEGSTFIDFLLNEFQITDQDLRDPQKKQELTRLMRANDQQATSLTQRAERDQKRQQRMTLQQEKDPRRAALYRKRLNLMKQVQKIDQDLGAATTQDQNNPAQSKM